MLENLCTTRRPRSNYMPTTTEPQPILRDARPGYQRIELRFSTACGIASGFRLQAASSYATPPNAASSSDVQFGMQCRLNGVLVTYSHNVAYAICVGGRVGWKLVKAQHIRGFLVNCTRRHARVLARTANRCVSVCTFVCDV